MQIVTLSLHRFDRIRDRAWAFGQMALARLALSRMPGLTFWKLCGSGTGEGFTPVPNTAVWAILAVWEDEDSSRAVDEAPVFRRYAARASDRMVIRLRPHSVRGAWAGATPFTPDDRSFSGPIAALTRATVRPGIALRFWRRVPDISRMIGSDPNVRFKIGIGEVPWLHQVTFSIWPDATTMAAFARDSGPHADAIRAVREGNWFREELYARFKVDGISGTWDGRPARERIEHDELDQTA